jgi:hypothetical protein
MNLFIFDICTKTSSSDSDRLAHIRTSSHQEQVGKLRERDRERERERVLWKALEQSPASQNLRSLNGVRKGMQALLTFATVPWFSPRICQQLGSGEEGRKQLIRCFCSSLGPKRQKSDSQVPKAARDFRT